MSKLEYLIKLLEYNNKLPTEEIQYVTIDGYVYDIPTCKYGMSIYD